MIQEKIDNVEDMLYDARTAIQAKIQADEYIAQSTMRKPFVPKTVATNAYNKQKEQSNTEVHLYQ